MAWRSTRRFSRTRRKILIFTQVPQFAIAHCSECVFRAGATPDVTVARDLEVLAYHMLYTKPWIGRKYAVAPALRLLDAETAHRAGVFAAAHGLLPRAKTADDAALRTTLARPEAAAPTARRRRSRASATASGRQP